MKTGIFYGSATGTTAEVAHKIAKELGVADADVHDVANTDPATLGDYDLLVLGSSTWGGGELEDDWYDFVAAAQVYDLEGKKIALFGCGDETMSDTFCDAVGILYDKLKDTGAEFIGEFPADVYTFSHSLASHEGTMRGLTIDEVNHSDLTDGRVKAWAEEVKTQA